MINKNYRWFFWNLRGYQEVHSTWFTLENVFLQLGSYEILHRIVCYFHLYNV